MIRNERGIALMVVLLVSLAVAAIALGASLMSMSTQAVNLYSDRLGTLEAVADGGIEWARARINANKVNYPDSGYKTLESGVSVKDASGAVIPGVLRWTYVGPTGISTGQYGVFGSAVVVTKDAYGNVLVRRGEVYQESFAKFAYFTDNEGSNIVFGNGDQIWGPVHTNDQIKINNASPTPQVWFHNTVETAQTISNKTYGRFDQGYVENGPTIPMPPTTALTKLKAQAQAGNTAITGNTGGSYGQATTRIEFVAVDLNNDGLLNGPNEGFFRVYQVGSTANAWWVVGDLSGVTYASDSPNCADSTGHSVGGVPVFRVASLHSGSTPHTKANSMIQASKRCFLGGSEFLDNDDNRFDSTDARGRWLRWPGPAVDSLVRNRRPDDWAFLWPITRAYNPSFKGVIEIDGNVAVSGTLRGQVTLAATGNVVIADDIRYATDPGAGTCADMLGLFAGNDVIIADNTLNSPQKASSSNTTYRTYDDTKDEFIQGVVLALDIFTAQNYDSGPNSAEACETKSAGRGCIYLTGGIIQDTRGAVGLTDGTGYVKRYAYDQCVLNNPPPYFPTTGHFARGRFFEVDPMGFDVTAFYHSLGPK
jgi:hypothetical protein